MKLLIISIVLLLVLLAYFFTTSVKFVKHNTTLIIERFGKYNRIVDSSYTILVPFIEKIKSVVSLDTQKIELPPQSIITSNNDIINIGTIINYQIIDPVKATYEIESLQRGIEIMTTKLLHELIEKMDYDKAMNSKTEIRHNIQNILTEASNAWGAKILDLDFSSYAKNI